MKDQNHFTYREASISDKGQLKDLGIISYGQFSNVLGPEHWVTLNDFLNNGEKLLELMRPHAVCQNSFDEVVEFAAPDFISKRPLDFLLSPESERWLAESDAAQIPLREGIPAPKLFAKPLAEIRLMNVEYAALATHLEDLSRGFLAQWVEQQNSLPRRGARD